MTLLALVCPHCATALDDAPERRVFTCASCSRTLTPRLDGRGLLEVPRRVIRPRRRPDDGARVVLLPLWNVTVHTEVMGHVGAALPAQVRIPAVGVQRLQTLLQFARNLTRAPVEPEEWEGIDVRGEGAEVSAEDALIMAETVVLRHLDNWPSDDQLATLEVPMGAAHLVDWPCAIRGSEMIELVGGLSIHRSLVENVDLRDRSAELSRALEDLGVGPA